MRRGDRQAEHWPLSWGIQSKGFRVTSSPLGLALKDFPGCRMTSAKTGTGPGKPGHHRKTTWRLGAQDRVSAECGPWPARGRPSHGGRQWSPVSFTPVWCVWAQLHSLLPHCAPWVPAGPVTSLAAAPCCCPADDQVCMVLLGKTLSLLYFVCVWQCPLTSATHTHTHSVARLTAQLSSLRTPV